MIEDAELLRLFAENGSENDFSELVRRNLGLVYGAAVRLVGSSHTAEDVAQAVFIDLARKARSLSRHPALASWLYTSARYEALKALRAERRRRTREMEAQMIQLAEEPEADWEKVRPLLDEVLNAMREEDREIILLRHFYRLSFAEISARIGIGQGAARMRLDRALDRMNRLFGTRGVRSSAAALGLALAAQPATAVPSGLAGTVTGAAVAAAGAGSVGAGIATFVMSKLTVATVIVAIAGLATAGRELHAQRSLRAKMPAPAGAERSAVAREGAALQTRISRAAATSPDAAELASLHRRLLQLKARPDGVADSALRAPQNRGRGTPDKAMETFLWAVSAHDLDTVVSFVRFADDSPENRAAFMAQIPERVKARFETPERICAAAMFGEAVIGGGSPDVPNDALAAMQVVRVREDHPGEARIELWLRSASGREIGGQDRYTLHPAGWGPKPFSLLDPAILKLVQSRFDATSGEIRVLEQTRSTQ